MPSFDSAVDVESTLLRVRAELERRRAAAVSARASTADEIPYPGGSASSAAAALEWLQRREFRLDELLTPHDSEFVASAYRALLKRAPDYEGARNFLGQLRSGQLSKGEVLGRIRFSPEGRMHGVRVRGLLPVLVFHSASRWPVVGYPLRLFSWLLRLPVLVRHFQALEAHSHGIEARLGEALASAAARMDAQAVELDRLSAQLLAAQALAAEHLIEAQQQAAAAAVGLNARIDRLQRESEQQLASLQSESALLAHAFSQIDPARRAAQIESRLAELDARQTQQLDELRTALSTLHGEGLALSESMVSLQSAASAQERRLQELQAGKEQSHAAHAVMPDAGRASDTDAAALDAFYVEFENRFRGSRAEIQQRARYYLPMIAACQAGGEDAPVLDLGCGRGEWLQVLREAGHPAYGIDSNQVMVGHCQQLGLKALQSDVLAHLRSLPAESVRAISAMHLIEHLDFRTLLALLDESLRVLCPGGLLLLETPNPENVHVGSCNFYMDPTHRNPLPPLLTQYLAESRGFTGAEIHRLSADRGEQRALSQLDVDQPGSVVLNQALADLHALTAAAPDYALIARKAV
ncbi:methyltransferase domain-containing protein [Aquimonas sp.]|jgi:SAM-dependent methyltransferase|uniref:methyltransferase domain-containing protein n=1 Tax=Aquimonas sp. TaxID=1872588 RepID=UPI0037BFF1EA